MPVFLGLLKYMGTFADNVGRGWARGLKKILHVRSSCGEQEILFGGKACEAARKAQLV